MADILKGHLGRNLLDQGIYVEINSCPERPVQQIPDAFAPLRALPHPIRLHQQLISRNLCEIYDSKYFVKLGGRSIRSISVSRQSRKDFPSEMFHRSRRR